MRVVFFGSPDYALPTLRRLLEAPAVDLVGVVTQPDRPRGRSGRGVPTPVAQLAREAGVPVLTPERIRRDTTEQIAALEPDVGVLAASAHILPSHLIEAIPHGILNVHASLLPRHRGASPVTAAILAGDEESGASVMLIVRELDAGPVLGTVATPIEPLDTTATLTARIAELGAERLMELLPGWVEGSVQAVAQDEALATYAGRIEKDDGVIDWTRSAEEIARAVRAYQPWPHATTVRAGERLTIHSAWPLAATPEGRAGLRARRRRRAARRRCCRVGGPSRSSPAAAVRWRCYACSVLGRRALDIEDYLNGDRALIGARLGE